MQKIAETDTAGAGADDREADILSMQKTEKGDNTNRAA